MYCKDHITRFVTDACIGMCGGIVLQLVAFLGHSLGAICLLCSDGAECHEQCAVNCPCIVEKCADNVLDSFDAAGGRSAESSVGTL